ncbi:MAG TPA: shikimate kinase [Thermodesulfobacteriota bacterium]|nr:shikimate kinase [Thermodesulfobacteriota bacterium]
MNIYFCGMIGSGKTPIGIPLARRLGWPFFDLDREMDNELGKSFHELVREQGWLVFREREYRICKRFAAMHQSVIGLGGGTVRYEWNTDILRGSGVMILLEADIAVLAKRVRAADRPRVNPGVSLEEDLKRIWSSSAHLYRQAADLIYRTDMGKEIEEEVEDLLGFLHTRGIARV